MNAFRGIGALLFLGLFAAHGSLRGGEPERFCYLAVPSAPAKCVFFACTQFKEGEKPAEPGKKPFFTLWRSGYWDERTPDIVVKSPGDWNHALELRARKAVAARPEMSGYPPQVAEFFTALETLRLAALGTPLVAQPLFQNQHFVGWENGRRMALLVTPDTLGPAERSRRLLRTMGAAEKESGQDAGAWMKGFLASLGVKLQSARYYPEYNVFVFEADGEFKEHMEILFSAIGG